MSIVQKIKDIEDEINRTQKNKATEHHIGGLKAKLAKLRTSLLDTAAGAGGGPGDGFMVKRSGDARVALIGFPSVGKSTLLSTLTKTESEAASYEFTTLTCIPGVIDYRGTSIQLLDLPGIIEGAAQGEGRGRQVIAVAKSVDLVLIVLDALREQEKNHKAILERELQTVGLRLNQTPPQITFQKKAGGGVVVTSTVPLTKLGPDPTNTVYKICKEYKFHNAQVLFREDCSVDQLIDVIEGNRHYVKTIYVYNKIDQISVEQVDALARRPHHVVTACTPEMNLDGLLHACWRYLDLVRVYTKRRGAKPDLDDPIVLTAARGGLKVRNACLQVHHEIVDHFKYAIVWGTSVRYSPMRVGLDHELHDEDVIQLVTKTAKEQTKDKNYSQRVQAYFDQWHEKKNRKLGKKPLKT